jgi:hypothetical protein
MHCNALKYDHLDLKNRRGRNPPFFSSSSGRASTSGRHLDDRRQLYITPSHRIPVSILNVSASSNRGVDNHSSSSVV